MMVDVHIGSNQSNGHSESGESHGFATEGERPFAVLVFPIFDGHVIWVRHPRRGWEVPGGKLEPGETPEEAVVRETHEEAGAFLENVEFVGDYRTSDGMLKWIYFADVTDVEARPEEFEIIDVMVPRPMWDPDAVKSNPDVSFIMKDEMYQAVWPLLRERIEAMK